MGTEVLRPHDYSIERIRVSSAIYPRRKNCNYGNSYSNPNFKTNPRLNNNNNNNHNNYRKHQNQPAYRSDKPDQRKNHHRFGSNQSEPSVSRRPSSADDLKTAKTGLTMEKVTILRRGESLDSKIKSNVAVKKEGVDLLLVSGTERLGPEPEMVPKHMVRTVDWKSPVSGKCDMYAGSAFAVSPEPSSLPLPSFSKKKLVVDDSATRDLRRLLRLD